MLDERRVKLMTRLAFYEQTEGKEDLKVSEYYRKDYVGMHMICSVLWVTFGYACLIGLIFLAGGTSLMGGLTNRTIVILAIAIIVAYLVLVIGYTSAANHICNVKHKKARQRVKKYNHDLIRLLKMYEKEN